MIQNKLAQFSAGASRQRWLSFRPALTLWSLIAPLLPVEPAKPKGGRPHIDNRAALTGILFVLRTGIP